MNVLIFPGSTEIAREINSGLCYCKDINLFLGGEIYNNHMLFTASDYHYLPSVHQENWLQALIHFVKKFNIDFIFPAHDDAIVALAKNSKAIPATVLAPCNTTCEVTRSKRKTYTLLNDIINTPLLYTLEEAYNKFPLFIKPDKGQGSQGASVVHSLEELNYFITLHDDLVISEYLTGEEFTVDCFSDIDSGLLYCQARTRERVRNGISMSSRFVALENIKPLASSIGAKLAMRGSWFFQVKYNSSNVLTLLEVSPRIAGTMALSRASGINLPLLTIYERLRYPLSLLPIFNSVQISRGIVNKYKHNINFTHVYLDFDDTVYINKKLCLPVMNFIFQCLNRGISINLITRHNGDINKLLEHLKIKKIFNKIIHLTNNEPKSKHIEHETSIFIDDSFSERLEVSNNLNIPTFDNSMIEILIND